MASPSHNLTTYVTGLQCLPFHLFGVLFELYQELLVSG